MCNISNKNNKSNTATPRDFLWAIGLSLAGLLFILNYIFQASMDVPTSDYIRIINNYLDNVFDIKKFLVPDLVARVPVTYLFRIINVTFFKYSTHFDRVVGLIFLSIFNFLIVKRVRETLKNNLLKNITSIVLTLVIFSLISWEMLLNGTGYAIFLFFDLVLIIYSTFEVRGRGFSKISKEGDGGFLENAGSKLGDGGFHKKRKKGTGVFFKILLVPATCFLAGSDYQVALICTLIFFSCINLVVNAAVRHTKEGDGGECRCAREEAGFFFQILLTSLIALIIYYIGNHAGEVANYTYVGMSNRSIFDIIIHDFSFCLNYIIKSLASIIIGVETFEYALTLGNIQEVHILLVGIVFLIIILFVIFLIFYYKIYERDLFSVMLFFHGLISILFVFIARAPFLNDHYGMSSRYAVQFMLVPVGIILILADIIDMKSHALCKCSENTHFAVSPQDFQQKSAKNMIKYIVAFSFIAFFITYGRVITTLDEMNKIPARRFCYESAYNLAHHIDEYKPSEENDKFLMDIFGYQRGADLIRDAFATLKKHNLNIFSK